MSQNVNSGTDGVNSCSIPRRARGADYATVIGGAAGGASAMPETRAVLQQLRATVAAQDKAAIEAVSPQVAAVTRSKLLLTFPRTG